MGKRLVLVFEKKIIVSDYRKWLGECLLPDTMDRCTAIEAEARLRPLAKKVLRDFRPACTHKLKKAGESAEV